jgi:hypothetical protein
MPRFEQKGKIMCIILDCDPGNGIPGSDIDDGLAPGARHHSASTK